MGLGSFGQVNLVDTTAPIPTRSMSVAEAFDPPYRYPGTVGAGTVAAGHEDLEPGAGSGVDVLTGTPEVGVLVAPALATVA